MINITDRLYIDGWFVFQAVDINTGKIVFKKAWKNLIMEVLRNYHLSMLDGTFNTQGFDPLDLQIKYIALGDGTTAPTTADTQLENERFRRPISNLIRGSDNVTTITSFLSSQANFRIREVGVFCGAAATATANSGLMISRTIVDFEKNENIALNIFRKDIENI